MSRFKKKQDFSTERLKICNICEFNTKNISNISIKQKLINSLSNILTFITTGKFNESDDSCSLCGCTLEFKVLEKEEKCDKNKWKSIYIPNKK